MPSKSSTKSVIRENERVMVFIDGSNLYHVLTQSCGRHDLQFDKFALKLANGRDLKRIYYYNIRQESTPILIWVSSSRSSSIRCTTLHMWKFG